MTSMSADLLIDGSYGEGGGQILRTSLSLSAITGRAVRIANVRAGRTKPGLQPQHLAAVRAAAALCSATLTGAAVGSMELRFEPQTPPQPGDYRFDIGTAGAAPLVAQTALLPLALQAAPSRVTITGGTHVPHAPTAEYLESVYVPALKRSGLMAQVSYSSAGFYPRGGGQIDVEVSGAASLRPMDFTRRGPVRDLRAWVVTSNLPAHVSERGADTVAKEMRLAGLRVAIEKRDRPSPGPGAAVVLAVECENGLAGFSALGARGKPMEQVAEEACEMLLAWRRSGAACDEHLADQLVLPLALAGGESCYTTPTITEHLRTVAWVVQRFLSVAVTLTQQDDGSGEVRIEQQSAS